MNFFELVDWLMGEKSMVSHCSQIPAQEPYPSKNKEATNVYLDEVEESRQQGEVAFTSQILIVKYR